MTDAVLESQILIGDLHILKFLKIHQMLFFSLSGLSPMPLLLKVVMYVLNQQDLITCY